MLRGVFAWEEAFWDLEGLTLYAPHHIAFPKGAEAAASFPHCQNPIRAL